jgi:hypothetical protein
MAFEEAIKVFKEESTEKAFKAARTTRDYLDALRWERDYLNA